MSNNKTLLKQIEQSSVSDFDKLCYKTLIKIPTGQVLSYKDLACLMGHPGAARAVGSAMARNPFIPNIPCHRVVKSDGSVGHYASGQDKKIALLMQEGVVVNNQKINKQFFYQDDLDSL